MNTDTLEAYLAGAYHENMDEIREVEETLQQAANVFIYAQAKNGAWPYQLHRNPKKNPKVSSKISQGTQAMIAAALARMSGNGKLASDKQARLKLTCKVDVRVALGLGLSVLKRDLTNGLRSSSFGLNDPVTLSHVLDLLKSIQNSNIKQSIGIKDKLESAFSNILSVAKNDPGSSETSLITLPEVGTVLGKEKTFATSTSKPEYLRNAFVPLRIVRSLTDLERLSEVKNDVDYRKNYQRFFESTLHEQLSYSEIPDSRFDPAELIFCLEGLVLVAPSVVDDRLFERVLTVLESKQEGSAHWRPNRPIYATKQGMTMLPVSVEGAVSLMRAVAIKDRHKNYLPLSTRTLPMVRRFWKWLQARSVRFDAIRHPVAAHQPAARITAGVDQKIPTDNQYHKLVGWHSEHVNDPQLIHLWDTSQVVEFMLAYRDLLQRSVAGQTLQFSKLKINLQARERPRKWTAIWQKTVEEFEPSPGDKFPNKVYQSLEASFIQPWATDRPKNFSMLLYGPPGTGKSTLAEKVAEALGMRMITVTVSDFLGRGGENVEARAKAVFQTLEAQFDTVILFDEIDAFLLDRDSELYREQATLFQFLTPGMLTKINDLRKLERSIFIIATNYKSRIDPAIKRKGRIDQHYLLPLPNTTRRLEIIRDLLQPDADLETNRKGLETKTLFMGYSDIRSAVEDAGGRSASPDKIESEVERADRKPQVFESYVKRIKSGDPKTALEDLPLDEFQSLIELWKEVQDNPTFDGMLKENRILVSAEAKSAVKELFDGVAHV